MILIILSKKKLLSKELPGKALEILHNLNMNSVEFQINECLVDLGNGDYTDFGIEKYLQELKNRFGKDLDN